jgi:hypothetical protein
VLLQKQVRRQLRIVHQILPDGTETLVVTSDEVEV